MSTKPVSPATARLKQALTLHRQGQFDAAAACYRQVLELAPQNFDALHLLGVISLQKGDATNAEQLIGQPSP